ncbi:hypothetical protein D3C83_226860 [compost metagenome]
MLLHLLGESLGSVLVILCLAAAAIGVIGALEAIYRSALYVFASEGVVPASFAAPELDEIWRVKPADPSPSEPPPIDV